MKPNAKILALMTALSAGIASAAAPTANPNGYTTSGVGIDNVATATFTDPATGNAAPTVSSNKVTTTVLPLPSFDLVYDSGSNDGGGTAGNPANSISLPTPGQAGTGTPDQATNAKPGSTINDTYWAVNNGNTPITVTITPNLGGTTGESVTYTYIDPADSTTKTSTANTAFNITIPVGGTVKLTQNTTLPATAAAGALFGASPQGSATAANNNGRGLPADMYENQTVANNAVTGPANGTDLQFQAITVYDPKLNNAPTAPGTSTVTPPGTTTATPGYNGATPANAPTGAGSPGTTPITVSGDQEIAYPPADTNAGADVVDFKNSVTNGGALSDIVTLSPVSVTGVTNLTKSATGTYTGTDAAGKTVTIQFLDPANNNTPVDTLTVAAGATANYITQVTYPDSDSLPNQKQIDVVVKAASGNNANVSDTTTDTILPPAAQFGDKSGETGSGATLTENPGTVATLSGNPGATAGSPMSVANTGTYTDSYKLSGYVVVPLIDGTYKIVPVVYTGATDTGTTTAVTTTDPSGNTLTANVPVYQVSNVAPATSSTVNATVAIPANAAATGTTPPKLQQSATGVFSTIALSDVNDPLVISPVGSVVIGKFTNTGSTTAPAVNTQKVTGNPGTATTATPAATDVGNPAGYDGVSGVSYLPQVAYDYKIISKNNYNTSVTNFVLKDSLNAALQYQSATCNVYPASYTTANPGTPVSSPAVTGPAVGTTGTVSCAAVTLAPGQVEILNIFVKIK